MSSGLYALAKGKRRGYDSHYAIWEMGIFIAAIAVVGLIPAKVICATDPVLQIRIRAPQSESDVAHSYFRELLALALKKTADEYGPAKVVVTSLNITKKIGRYPT